MGSEPQGLRLACLPSGVVRPEADRVRLPSFGCLLQLLCATGDKIRSMQRRKYCLKRQRGQLPVYLDSDLVGTRSQICIDSQLDDRAVIEFKQCMVDSIVVNDVTDRRAAWNSLHNCITLGLPHTHRSLSCAPHTLWFSSVQYFISSKHAQLVETSRQEDSPTHIERQGARNR